MAEIKIEPQYLASLLEARLEEVRVVRRRRTSPGVKRKRARYYRKRKARLKRLASRRRKRPAAKRAAKRRIKIRKRLGLKPGSRRRISLQNSTHFLGMVLLEGREVSQQEIKFELIRGFKTAAKLAESLQEKEEITPVKRAMPYNEDFCDLPELPEIKEDYDLDDDFRSLIGITKKTIAEETTTSKGIASDAIRMAECIERDEVDFEEAQQILAMMTEELDKQAESFIDEDLNSLAEGIHASTVHREEVDGCEVEVVEFDYDSTSSMDSEHHFDVFVDGEKVEEMPSKEAAIQVGRKFAEAKAKQEIKEQYDDDVVKVDESEEVKSEDAKHDSVRIYDNGGESVDRYTLVVDRGTHSDFYGLGSDVSAGGFNQFLGTDQDGYREGAHLGKLIQLSDLPERVKKAALSRIDDDLGEATNGHGQGDEGYLTEVDPSLRPPKRWFTKMMKTVKGDNPEAIIGAIWRDLPVAKKKEIRGREGKHYGPAPKSEMTEDFKTAQAAFEKQGIDAGDIKDYFETFKKLKDSKIKDPDQKNIDKWAQGSWDAFVAFVDSMKEKKSKSEIRKLAKMEGAELIAENEDWYVYKIDTHEACMIYGSGSKWCITQQGGTHWKRYSRNSQFYFLISKSRPESDKWYKIAVQVERDGKVTYWDATNSRHSSLPEDLNVPEFKKDPKAPREKTGNLSVEDIRDEFADELEKIIDNEIQSRVASMYDEDNYDAVTEGQDLRLPYWMKESYEHRIFKNRESKGKASSALSRLMELLPAVQAFVDDPDNAYLSWSNSDGMMPWSDANYPEDAVILKISGSDGHEESQIDVSDLMDMLGIESEDEQAFREFLEEDAGDHGISRSHEADDDTVTLYGRHQVVSAIYMKSGEIAKLVEEILSEDEIEPEVAAEARDLVEEMKENAGDYR